MEHFGYLFAAYSLTFAGIFVFVLFMWQRQSRLESELRTLESRLKSLDDRETDSAPEPRSSAQS